MEPITIGTDVQKISEHEEYPIFDKLLTIKQRLMLLKSKTNMKTQDILPIQQEVEYAIKELMKIRGGVLFKSNHINNRTDDVLNKVCQLLSLCFMTIGKWHESLAIFCQVIAIKNCFYQLEQIGIYDEKMLEPYNAELKQFERTLTEDEQKCALPEPILELIRYNDSQCKQIYDKLLSTIRDISPTLIPTRDKLLQARNELVNIAFQEEFVQEDIIRIQQALLEIDNRRGKNGVFFGLNEGTDNEALALIGQGTLADILENNFNACHALLNAENTPIIESIRKRLIEIRNDLEGIEMTSKWSLRQTDLFSYQLQLHDIARMLHEEVQFEGEEGSSLLSFLLATCYNIMLSLLGEGPSVAESLLPIYNQLSTLRDCLKRLKSFNCKLAEDEKMLYLFKLRSIDMKRENGAFHDKDGGLPEGQSTCVYALEECYKLIEELTEKEDEETKEFDTNESNDVESSYDYDESQTDSTSVYTK